MSSHEDIERGPAPAAGEQLRPVQSGAPPTQSPASDVRAARAAAFIPRGARVLDLGCGVMALERFLPMGCTYIPSDVVVRDERTVLCDLNAGVLPQAQCDIVSALGVLEYINDPPAWLARLRALGVPVIVSYNAAGQTGADRRALGWVNDFTRADLRRLFSDAGFSITRSVHLGADEGLMRLEPGASASPAEKTVWVVSASNYDNFGDRLGVQLLSQVLPAHATVRHIYNKPFHPPAEGEADLLIMGIGNSLFGPFLNDELIALTERAKVSIGIFGTQYRETMPLDQLGRLLDRLHTWYARYEEDVLLYGRERPNVRHLGDWLIDAFPMASATDDRQLVIDANFPIGDAPDRVIQTIQRHRTVISARLHPLLCALTSAEQVAYAEQRPREPTAQDLTSGKFRSMLLDVFGSTFPEEGLWRVDRSAVIAYKQKVAANIAALRADIAEILA